MEDENITQDDFLKAFGITNDPANQGDGNDAGNTDNQDDQNPTDGANPGTEGDQTGDQQQDQQNDDTSKDGENNEGDNGQQDNQVDKQSKQAQAFAAMRVELAQKNKMLENVATVLGLDPKSQDSMAQLQSKLTEALAKKQGIPTETLERLQRLEEMEQQRNIDQIRNNAFVGFQKVKTQFGLNDEQLQDFANELVADGKNPFVQSFDLVTEYKLRNFDRLLEQAKNQGIQTEMNRASKAQNNASAPLNKTGGTADNEPEKITTVKELNNWFNQQQSGK